MAKRFYNLRVENHPWKIGKIGGLSKEIQQRISEFGEETVAEKAATVFLQRQEFLDEGHEPLVE